jgi:hypothetical protein
MSDAEKIQKVRDACKCGIKMYKNSPLREQYERGAFDSYEIILEILEGE